MKKLFFFALALVVAASCCSKPERKAEHVFVIAFDGWGSFSMDSVSMPNTRAVMADGCYTLAKRTVLPSDSAPNWCSMFCGAPVEFTGWSNNGSGPDVAPVYVNERGCFPSIFTLLHEQLPESNTACIYEWGGIRPLIDPEIVDFCVKEKPENIASLACEHIKNVKPEFMVVIYDDPDHVGHSSGYYSPEYYAKMEDLDACLGQIVAAIKEAGIYDDSIIIVTADHGGNGRSHGGRSLLEMGTPFIVAGKNIAKKGDLGMPMMQYDLAHTVAEMFALEVHPQWRGQSVSQIFVK
jgi:predicted AlkP superfamily pyrophosphatase or phosphodiesterase